MLKENNSVIRKSLITGDLFLTLASLVMVYYLRLAMSAHIKFLPHIEQYIPQYIFLSYFILPVWACLLLYYGAYDSIRRKNWSESVIPFVKAVASGGLILFSLLFIFKMGWVSRSFVLMFLLLNLFLLVAARTLVFAVLHSIRKKGYNYRTILVIGAGDKAEAFSEVLMAHKEWGIRVLGRVAIDGISAEETRRPPSDRISNLNEFMELITKRQVDEVVFVVPASSLGLIEGHVLKCEEIGIKASIVADFYPHKIAKMSIDELEGWPLLAFNTSGHIESAFIIKRFFDIAATSLALIFLLPAFISAAIAIKLTSSGPVLFRQTRCGLNGRKFEVLKFRTMVENAHEIRETIKGQNEMDGPVFKIRNDPRVTRLGKFLRKYSIDELPQLINVLKGDMSIVGPRPPLPEEVEKYNTWQRRRLSVRPGITCSWQVNGRNKIGFDDWVKLDLEYIDSWSFMRDFKIILKTIPAVLKGTGF